jgi:hypothetical protein
MRGLIVCAAAGDPQAAKRAPAKQLIDNPDKSCPTRSHGKASALRLALR